MLTARIVSSLEETGLDERQWNELAAGSQTNTVFQTHQWVRSWLRVLGDRCRPLIIVVTDGASVVGVAPLVVDAQRSSRQVVRFLGDGRADYCDFLASGETFEVRALAVDTLLADRRWDVIDLGNIPSTSATAGLLRAGALAAGYRMILESQFECPTLLVEGHEDAVRRILDKPSLRRRENYLRRRGTLVYRDLRTVADIAPHLDRFFDQHVERWSTTATPSLFVDSRQRRFYRELLTNLAPAGWVLLTVVEFDGRPIAYHFGFDYNGALLWYKPSFDPDHAARSPGLLLVRRLIAYALEHARRELDFTVGRERFKSRFTNSSRTTLHAVVYRHRAAYLAAPRRGGARPGGRGGRRLPGAPLPRPLRGGRIHHARQSRHQPGPDHYGHGGICHEPDSGKGQGLEDKT
jgi:CelD/BcsL family acetyltransferase involved in cellulose biosynthesis